MDEERRVVLNEKAKKLWDACKRQQTLKEVLRRIFFRVRKQDGEISKYFTSNSSVSMEDTDMVSTSAYQKNLTFLCHEGFLVKTPVRCKYEVTDALYNFLKMYEDVLDNISTKNINSEETFDNSKMSWRIKKVKVGDAEK